MRRLRGSLAGWLGIEFHAKEPADWAYRGKRVLAELERRAHTGDQRMPSRCLIILDNVDDASLLGADQIRILPRAKWLHVIATSQLGPAEVPDIDCRDWFPVDRLSDHDAFLLLEKLRPSGRFRVAAEQEMARTIVAALGGFTMAVEAAGIFLARFSEDGESLLKEIRTEGLTGFESATDRVERNLFLHDQKRLTATLRPILDRLNPDEWLTLEFASLMPPDSVVWEWIESLVGDRFPAVEMAEGPGEIGRWTAIRERLQSLRLITTSADVWAGRIHRLVQEVVWARYGFKGSELRKRLIEFAFRRCSAVEQDWEERFGDWELEALRRWALHLIEEDELGGGALEGRIADLLRKAGRYREEERLRRHVVKVLRRRLGNQDPKTMDATYDLGVNLVRVGRYEEAINLLDYSLSGFDRQLGESDPNTLACALALANAWRSLGNLEEAEPLCRRALEGFERVLGPDHPKTLGSVSDLAVLLSDQGNYQAAERLYRRAFERGERILGPDHPDILTSINNLGAIIKAQGNYETAEPLCRTLRGGRAPVSPSARKQRACAGFGSSLYLDVG